MRVKSEAGVALILVVTAVVLLSALGTALVLTSSSEALIAGSFRAGIEARFAAAALADRVVDELAVEPDWQAVLDGLVRSPFTGGAPTDRISLTDGTEIDLGAAASLLPGGRLYAYGYLADMVPSPSPLYLVAIVAPSPSDPSRLDVRADAFGLRAMRRAVRLTVLRATGTDADGIRVLSRRHLP